MVKLLLISLAVTGLYAQTQVNYPTNVRNGPILSDALASSTFVTNCATALAAGQSLSITKQWTAVSTMTCAASLVFNGGSIQPGSGQTVTLTGAVVCPGDVSCFDQSAGGTVRPAAKTMAYVTPQNYGAKCNGSTDDTAPFNGAIGTSIASAIPVHLLGCNYRVNTASGGLMLNIASSVGVTIIGAGSEATTISTTTGSADLLGSLLTNVNPVYTLTGFTLQGPDGTCGTTTSGNGLRFSGGTGAPIIRLTDINAYGFCGSGKAGVYLSQPENGSYRDGILNYNDIGLHLASATNAMTFSNLLIQASNSYGIYDTASSSQTFENITVQSNIKTGAYLTGTGASTWTNCHFENNNTSASASTYALSIIGTSGAYSIGNVFIGDTFNGTHENIQMVGVSNGQVVGTTFIGGITSSAATPLIYEQGFATINTFLGPFINGWAAFNGGAPDASDLVCLVNDINSGFAGCMFSSTAPMWSGYGLNTITTESGANNAIVGTGNPPIQTGLQVTVILSHTLQAGANTFNYTGAGAASGAKSIKSHFNSANNIATAYISGAPITLYYNGTAWLDMSQ